MKISVSIILMIALFAFNSCQNKKELVLIDHNASDYSIIISANATQMELKAAYELRKYLEEMSGVNLEITTDVDQITANGILIGKSNRIESQDLIDKIDRLDKDGFIIKTIGDKLLIAGGNGKGVIYGVYTFLEDYLGCRRYSAEVSVIPVKERIVIGEIDDQQQPAFSFRELHMPDPRSDASFRDWHKLDFKEGGNEWGMFVHTFDDFIPYDKYFKMHPEYFSYMNVQRIPDGQLCLSSPEVFDIVIEGLKERMAEKPKALYWSVSQNDTYKPCECSNCNKEYEEYGGYSGAMVHFVNSVAAEFPDKVISTLAYQYTRSAPDKIKPADNVNIMFCSIECNRSLPLATDPSSESFRKDTKDWCKLTNNIFMWDYVVQFRSLISPFPNFNVLQPNIQYFRDNGIEMMFQQGSGGLQSEFVELRTYIIAKLLWNPDADVDAIMDDFLNGYYGPAGKYLRKYIDRMNNELKKSGGDLGIYGYPYDGIKTYLTPDLIKQYEILFDEAERAVKDSPDFLERLKIARLPLEFAILDISLRDVSKDLTYFAIEEGKRVARKDMLERLETFTALAKQAGIKRYWEHGNYPDDYKATIKRYVSSSLENHVALHKPVRLMTEYSEKYPVGGANALTDGLKGINDYHFNWLGFEGPHMVAIIDLEELKEIRSIECDFLQEIKSWVFLPEEVQFFSSNNAGSFKFLGLVKNPIAENREGTFIETFKLEFDPIDTRYIKVAAKNKGICPDWHPGATYPSWIFCDEVIVW